MFQNYIYLFLVVFSLLVMNRANCSAVYDCPDSLDCHDCHWDFDIRMYSGYIQGKSLEIVYNRNESCLHQGKVSQLDWEIKNLWIIGGMVRKTFFNDCLHLCLNGWTKAHASKSTMVDRDFRDPIQDSLLTDISRSPNTHLKGAKMFDISLGYDFYSYLISGSKFSFTILGGYKYLQWDWKAYGGKFRYNYGQRVGWFPDILVISYKQKFWIPYVGLKGKWEWNQWKIAALVEYTNQARITDHDFHALRDATFTGTFRNGHYWLTGLEVTRTIWKNIDFNLDCVYEKLNKARGDSVQREQGFTIRSSDSVGIEHDHYTLALGLTAHF